MGMGRTLHGLAVQYMGQLTPGLNLQRDHGLEVVFYLNHSIFREILSRRIEFFFLIQGPTNFEVLKINVVPDLCRFFSFWSIRSEYVATFVGPINISTCALNAYTLTNKVAYLASQMLCIYIQRVLDIFFIGPIKLFKCV